MYKRDSNNISDILFRIINLALPLVLFNLGYYVYVTTREILLSNARIGDFRNLAIKDYIAEIILISISLIVVDFLIVKITKKPFISNLVFLITPIILILSNFEKISNEVYKLLDNHFEYLQIIVSFAHSYYEPEAKTLLLLIVIVLMLIFSLILTTCRKRINPSVLVVIFSPFLVWCFIIRTMPSAMILSLLVGYWLIILIYSYLFSVERTTIVLSDKKDESKIFFRSVVIILVFSIVLGGIYPFFNNRLKLFDTLNSKVTKVVNPENIQKLAKNIKELFQGETEITGELGVSEGYLGLVDEVLLGDEDVINVYSKENHSKFYIRAFIASNYKGDRWEKTDRSNINEYLSNKEDSINLTDIHNMSFNIFQGLYNNEDAPKELKYIKNQVSLNNLSLDIKYDYYPYYIKIKQLDNPYDDELSIATNNYEKKYDTFIYDEKNLYKKDYEISEYIKDESLIKKMDLYEKYVYDNYLDSFVSEYFEKVFEEVVIEYEGEKYYPGKDKDLHKKIGIKPFIDYVLAFYNKQYTYTLKPGKLEEGEDFIDKFLFDTKKGYCMHFASASTMIFRKMGIPARYVEGYLVDLKGGKNNIVKSKNAHAWVEVYEPGIGWVPVETTLTYIGKDNEEQKEPSSSEPQTKPNDKEEQGETQKVTQEEQKETNENIVDKEESDQNIKEEGSKILDILKILLNIIKIILLVIAIILILFLSYRQINKQINKIIYKKLKKDKTKDFKILIKKDYLEIKYLLEYYARIKNLKVEKFCHLDELKNISELLFIESGKMYEKNDKKSSYDIEELFYIIQETLYSKHIIKEEKQLKIREFKLEVLKKVFPELKFKDKIKLSCIHKKNRL